MADIENVANLPDQAGQEIGASGTYIYSGFISGEEYNRDLIGKHGLQVFDTMRRSDPTVHAALTVCKNPIIGAIWDIDPASSDDIDIEIAEYIKCELFSRKIMWQDFLRQSLSCLDFGHSIFEIVYEVVDYNSKPHIGLSKLASRKQRSILRWETVDKQDGITQYTPTKGMCSIPREKLVYVINEKEGDNYEGISLLRYAYKPWKIKDALEIMNAVALERMAIGIPIIKQGVSGSTTNTPIAEPSLVKVRTALKEMRANESSYLELPFGVIIEMLDMKAQSTKDVLPTIEHEDVQITLSVLAQFLMLGSNGGSGSRAVSADHSTLFVKSLEAVARTIQQPIQQDIINRLVDLNYSNLKNGYPKLVFSEISDDDVTAFASAVSSLMTAKALTPDPDLENRTRKVLDLPSLSTDDYDNYREIRQVSTPPILPDNTQNGSDPKNNNIDDTKLPKDDKTNASLIRSAKNIQQQLIAHIFED